MRISKYILLSAVPFLLAGCLDTEPLGKTLTSKEKSEAVEDNPDRLEASVNAVTSAFSQYQAIRSAHSDFGYPTIMLHLESRGVDMVSDNIGYNWFNFSLTYDNIDYTYGNNREIWGTLYNQIKMAEEEMYSVDSQGWEKLAEFDLEDVYNEERLKVRFKIKQALKRIGCSRIDRNKNLFVLEYIDGKTQRVVIENSRGTRKGRIFIDLKTINDRQILESNGLVLHPCLDMLTDKNWKPEEEIPGPLQEFGI